MGEETGPGSISLVDAIDRLSVEQLKQRLTALDERQTLATRKAELQAALRRQLGCEGVSQLWLRLNTIEQAAVQQSLYCTGGQYRPERLLAIEGKLPDWSLNNRGRRSACCKLELLFYRAGKYRPELLIPAELQSMLREFAPEPKPFVLAAQVTPGEEEYEQRPVECEHGAQAELAVMLSWLQQGKLAVSRATGKPSAALLKRLSAELSEFYTQPSQESTAAGAEHIKAFAWCQLLQYAPWVENHSGKLRLKGGAGAILGQNPAEIIKSLWQAWLEQTTFDEFSRIDEIKGQTGKGKAALTEARGRRRQCNRALHQCFELGNRQHWVRFADFSDSMLINGFDFDITTDPWLLYLHDAHYGTLGYDGHHDWSMLQGRYLRCLLLEYAATLGVIDVVIADPDKAQSDLPCIWGTEDMLCLSRYDGLTYLRLTSLGAYVLGLTDDYVANTGVPHTTLTAQSQLRIVFAEECLLSEQVFMAHYADVVSDSVWQLNRDKLLTRVENGDDLSQLEAFIKARDPQPFLPEEMEREIQQCRDNAQAVSVECEARLLRCQSETLAKQIADQPVIKAFCHHAGGDLLVVPTARESMLRAELHRLGIGFPQSSE